MKVIPTRLVRTKFDIDILIDKISPVQYKVPIRVSDSCLTPIQLIFVAIAWRQQVNFQWNDDEVRFNLDQPHEPCWNNLHYHVRSKPKYLKAK
jgi:hypothetical protein